LTRAAAPHTSRRWRTTWPTVGGVSQLSFFTAESVPPAVADLSGVLAASGQIVLVGAPEVRGARLSVVVDQTWRASGLVRTFVCTLKFQGETDHATAARFAAIPGSTLRHLYHNKHELTWIKLD